MNAAETFSFPSEQHDPEGSKHLSVDASSHERQVLLSSDPGRREFQPATDLRVQLLERTLQACTDEYSEKGRTFSDLDRKAQNTSSIAGIFLAAALAFLQGEGLKGLIQLAGRNALLLLGMSIVLLLVSILFCLLAMRIRRIVGPIESADVAGMVNDILSVDASEFTNETFENYFRDQINPWQERLRAMSAVNESKAQTVLIGQVLLAIAVLLVAVLLLMMLVNVWVSAVP